MRKRLIAVGLVTGAALVSAPMTGTSNACTDTINRALGSTVNCSTTCPPPTYPRAAVYVDGHWVVVCL